MLSFRFRIAAFRRETGEFESAGGRCAHQDAPDLMHGEKRLVLTPQRVVLKRFFPQPHTFVDRNGKCVCDRSEINVASSRRAGAVPAAPRCRWPASATSSCAHRHRHMLRRIAGMTNSQECWLSSSNRRFDNLEFDVFECAQLKLFCFVLLRSNICDPRSWLVFVSQEMRKRDARRKLTGHLVSALLGHEKRIPFWARFSLVFLGQTIQNSNERKRLRLARSNATWTARSARDTKTKYDELSYSQGGKSQCMTATNMTLALKWTFCWKRLDSTQRTKSITCVLDKKQVHSSAVV